MKGMARSFVCWTGINGDIELAAKSCLECAKPAHSPPKFTNHHWEYPKGSWERIHIDYAGPFKGFIFLIVVDAYSKWLEVATMNTSTATATIKVLDALFARYGVPVTVVLDNGRQFISKELRSFLKIAGVKYLKLTTPYHPSTNGQAEICIGTVKDALQNMTSLPGSITSDKNRFLQLSSSTSLNHKSTTCSTIPWSQDTYST